MALTEEEEEKEEKAANDDEEKADRAVKEAEKEDEEAEEVRILSVPSIIVLDGVIIVIQLPSPRKACLRTRSF